LGFPLASPYAFPSLLPSLENTRFFSWFLPRVSLLFPSSMILFPTRRLLLFSSNTAARSAPIRSSAPHRCRRHNAACCCKRQLCCNHQPAGHFSHPAATNPHPAGPSHQPGNFNCSGNSSFCLSLLPLLSPLLSSPNSQNLGNLNGDFHSHRNQPMASFSPQSSPHPIRTTKCRR